MVLPSTKLKVKSGSNGIASYAKIIWLKSKSVYLVNSNFDNMGKKKKFKMPTVQQFLKKKRIYDDKKDPVWVYLENEMRANEDKKPYNEKVGWWLKFLKDLKIHYFCEAKRIERRLHRETGPPWYCEFSIQQRSVLADFRFNIHQDLLEDTPDRVRRALRDLGCNYKFPRNILMKAMADSVEDPGIFMWYLYSAIYKSSPTELLKKYDMNAMILMSSLVFIDLDECIRELEKLTAYKPPPKVVKVKKPKKYFEPKVKYGSYLQQMYVPCNIRKPIKKPEPKPLGYKFHLRSKESYDRLIESTDFLEKRKEMNFKAKMEERVCTYKFWEPPSTLRNTDPKMAAYVNKLKMIKKKAKMKYKEPYKHVQYQVSGVSYTGGTPNYILSNVGILPTGYIPINGGAVMIGADAVTRIMGYWNYPKPIIEKCDRTCDCLAKWESTVMEYLMESKCRCGHLYDFRYDPKEKSKEKYFYPPTRHGPYWMDYAKVFQMDPTEDFIKDTVKEAIMSGPQSEADTIPSVSLSGLKEKELLQAFLADLSNTFLIIPHLPEAHMLNNLQEWVRRRVKGDVDPKTHKNWLMKSGRRWMDLKHMDFKARAYRIPFTLKQLDHMTWDNREHVQELFKVLLDNFVTRNRLKQFEQTRLWWPTTKFDAYPSKAFLEVFFTYMPGRIQDTFLVNPYSAETTPTYGAKTCPIGN